MNKLIRALIVLLIATMIAVSLPRPAAAKVDVEDGLIIGGAVIGGLIVVALIGTLIVYRKRDLTNELLTKAPPKGDPHGPSFRLGPACAPSPGGETPLLCW